MRNLIVFYSYPEESSLTAIFRGIEVVRPDKVFIISSQRRCDEVRELTSKLKEYFKGYDIDFIEYCGIPDIETSLSNIPYVTDGLRTLIRSLDGDVYVISSAGSRLELVSFSMLIDRSRTEVLYISFFFGPWSGAFYPYTPKPLQIAHEIHPIDRGLGQGPYPHIDNHEELLSKFAMGRAGITTLRRETLIAQYIINSSIQETLCIDTRDHSECSCGGLRIEVCSNRIPVLSIDINDYCSRDQVLNGISSLCEGIEKLRNRLSDQQFKILKLIMNFTGICLPIVEECSFYKGVEGYVLIDALKELRKPIGIDTNLAYFGIHTQIYEDPITMGRFLVIPLCLYLEMYKHQAQVTSILDELRASIASLAIEELRFWNLSVDVEASHTPCEVGLAMSSRGKYVVATGDRRAYEKLMKFLNIDSILVRTVSISRAKFKTNEHSRKVSYAYYALAQLKGLLRIKEVVNTLGKANIQISITRSEHK